MTKDLLLAIRWLGKHPLFTASVTAILALGIGANTAVFSVVDAVLLRPLPYESSERLVRIEESSAKVPMNGVPAQDYLEWRERSDLFDRTVPFIKDFVTISGAGEPDQISALRTSAELFSVLGARAQLGRALIESDGEFNAPNSAVISDRLWRRQWNADPGVVGRSLAVSGTLFTIAGVMPPDFEFSSSDIDLWTPLRLTPASTNNLQVLGRVKKGLAVKQVESAMQVVGHRLEDRNPQQRAGLQVTVSPWRETVQRQYELTLVFILIAVGLILLVACADVGGLLLSRAVQRQKEIAIRASLGAGFWRVTQQLLAESLVLALLGSIAGMAVAHYALQFLVKQMAALPFAVPHMQRVAINGRVLLFNTVLCLLLACLFSIAPVLLALKTDLQLTVRSGQGASSSKHSARIFSILIASEAAFAFLLLVGSGLMIRSLIRLQEADHGLRPDHVLTMRVPLGTSTQPRPPGQYDTKPRQMAYYRELIDRLRGVPGVGSVAVVNNLPLSGVNTTTPVQAAGGPMTLTMTRTISPQYFSTMGIPLVAGRTFTEADQASAPGVAVVNEFLARQLFSGRDPIGQMMPSAERDAPSVMVVGVVRNTTQNNYDQPAKGEVYRPYQQFIFGAFMSTIVVRTSADPLSLASTLSKEVWALDPNQPVVKVQTMNQVIANSIWRPRFSAWIFSALGVLAILLTFVGVYGVVAYTATLKAREVAIRVALGATPRNVIAVILRDAMIPLGAGLAISFAGALLLSRLLASLLYEVAGTDPITYLSAGALVLAIGIVASAGPAWRAAKGDPLQALRNE